MKTKILLSVLISFSALVSCGGNNSPKDPGDPESITIGEQVISEAWNKALGSYVGMFTATESNENNKMSYENKINLTIDSISKDRIFGHSAVAGNVTPFSGSVTMKDNIFEVKEAKELGNGKYNGIFNFMISPADSMLNGDWIANDKSLSAPKYKFDLKKREFKYDPNLEVQVNGVDLTFLSGKAISEEYQPHEFITEDASKFNTSVVELKPEDVENMYKGDLEVLRNSIYARHGYTFQNKKTRNFFERYVDWYVPVSKDVRRELTKIEISNIDLIKRYEEHAQQYYDDWGR